MNCSISQPRRAWSSTRRWSWPRRMAPRRRESLSTACWGRCCVAGANGPGSKMNERKRTQTAETVRCHLWVRGIVQGVVFRMFAERAARRLGLAGLVLNMPDGRVEIVVAWLQVMPESLMADVYQTA